jgi:sialate O-acetylesterase
MKVQVALLLAGFSAITVSAQVTLPKILSDNMVVQRDLPVHVWGMASPDDHVSVTFRGETRSTTATKLGRWSVYMKPGSAGGPFELTVKGTGALEGSTPAGGDAAVTLRDVLVGDVWVASGQSNMEFALKNASTSAADLPKADDPRIRLLLVDKRPADFPQDDLSTKGWETSSPESAKEFSAVAWYFAREIEQKEHVPVGVIDSTWGGTPAEAWTSMTALGSDPGLASLFAVRGTMLAQASDAALQVKDERHQRDEAEKAGKPAPQFPWHPDLASYGPANLWNGMIAPIVPFGIKGALWYQGEANAGTDRYPTYDRVMRTLIEDWRHQWGIGQFPFFYVQLANWNTGEGTNWAYVRNQQLKTLGLRNTGMAVIIDIGDPNDIHPKDKLDVGHRLALWARASVYGETGLEYSGPLFRQAVPEGNSIRVWFDHAKGLTAKGGEVNSVEVAGPDGKFYTAKAAIEGDTLVASSPDVPNPVAIRYGWASDPRCNLFNSEGLPASPFTSEK